MTQFSKNPKVAAFQYDPEVLASTGQLNSEDFVAAASSAFSIHYAESAEDGEWLSVFLYTSLNDTLSFKLMPYEWLVEDETFKVMSDEEFRKFAGSV